MANSTELFKNRVRELAARGAGIGGLAKKMGVASPTVSHMLREPGPSPTLNKVDEVAKALGVEPYELIKELPDLTPDAWELARAFDAMDDFPRQAVITLVRSIKSSQKG